MSPTKVNSNFSREQLLETFNPKTTTWLVTSLQQKLVLQQHILPQFKVLPERAFLRVNEFWQLLLKQNFPDIKVVSKAWMQIRLDHWLENQKWSVAQSKGAGHILLQYLQHMLPALSAPNGQELLSEWFQENPSAFIRWGHWAQLSFQAWKFICDENMILSEWAPAFLNQNDEISYPYSLIVDLNYDLSPLESEVLFKINAPKQLLVENEAYIPTYKDDFLSYHLLFEKLNEQPQKPSTPQLKSQCEYQRFSTQLGEIKNLCAHIRELIQSGVEPEKIAVLAPKIEDYWSVLYSFFEQEGLQTQKRQSIHLHSLPQLMSWFARIKKELDQPDFYDLETDFSAQFNNYEMSYSNLKQQFRLITDQSDFKKLRAKHKLGEPSSKEEEGRFQDFIDAVTPLYKSSDTESLVRLLSQAHLDLQPDVVLPYSQWLKYLKALSAKIEISERKLASGIICENLEAFHPWGQEYIFVLGLTDENVKGQQSLCAINHFEVSSIGQSTGFYFKRPESKNIEIKLHQFIYNESPLKLFLSFPEANLLGDLQAPAKLWILKAIEAGVDIQNLNTPRFCRWDVIQRLEPEEKQKLSCGDQKLKSEQLRSLNEDLGRETPVSVKTELSQVSLSVSKMERYLKCPFIFTSEKLFSLQSLPDLDLDLDHLTTGKVMHALFEKILEKNMFHYNASQVDELLKDICKELDIVFFEEFVQVNFYQRYQKMAKNFIEFESSWRNEFPQTQTVGLELAIKSLWNPQNKTFDSQSGQPFFGYIDRVDQDPNGNYVIIDYKSSGAGQNNYKAWVNNKKLQLALYAFAVETGATSLPKGEVVGAFYFNVKDMKRDKGFQVSDCAQELLPDKPNHHIALTKVQKTELYDQITELFNEAVKQLNSGFIHPKPDDIKDCKLCDWRELCRAPHLN